MSALEVLIYEAIRQKFDDRYPPEIQPISEHTQLEFEPIPDVDSSFGDGHCYTLVRGGERPSYRLAVPGGERFVHELTQKQSVRGEDGKVIRDEDGRELQEVVPTGRTKTFVRLPGVKAADGVVLLCMAQYRLAGIAVLPLEGGKAVELLDDPTPEVRPATKGKGRAAKVPAATRPEPAPLPPPRLTVEFGPPPVGPPVKRTQLSFLDEMEVAG